MSVNRRSVNIFDSSASAMNKFSDQVKGDSYYGYTDGLHTLQVTYNEYVGRLRIQATLSLGPQDTDWFDIVPDATTGKRFNPEGYIQFNADEPGSGSEAYTFQGNFTYIRVFMDRRHVGDGETYDPSYGQISRVILSS
jgi:hypothetical protein